MDLDSVAIVLASFVGGFTTASVLEFFFPSAIGDPSPDGAWMQLVGALTQLTLYLYIAPTLSGWILLSASMVQVNYLSMGVYAICLFLQPNMIAKFQHWSSSLKLLSGGWFNAPPVVGPPPPTAPMEEMTPTDPVISTVKLAGNDGY